ncbi:hypothetical protein CAPTEDRAFT_163846 [Capitella teleta]|uniref:PUM-HD domain-containing protein n=1 Tax=Capitella teleta TaxID=283909 RepID=R7VIL9_CAPTE|nr:hypothetical protein CAPTEDRAFT_163846 [Capitella teleta]|eukprot:ELU16136.1 hypothetical protein CAPTEDRAFT_163846 [Capitella teleta]
MADDSINLSIPSLQLTTLDTPEQLSPKKKRKAKKPSASSIDTLRSGPDGDSVIVKQKFPPLPSGNTPKSPSKSKAKSTPLKKGKKKVVVEQENPDSDLEQMDVSWEKAVETARGLPEGATSSDDEMKAGSDQEADGEKPKKKKLKVLKAAAKQFKKLTGEGAANGVGKKRKMEDETEEKGKDSTKKVKLVELKTKERKKLRKKSNESYEITERAKELWEDLRRFELTPEKRQEMSKELYGIIKGKASRLIYAHDTSRVIQCLLKYGTQTYKDALFEELKDEIPKLMISKYAKYFVRRLLKYGTKVQRNFVFSQMKGNICRFIKHAQAGEIVEYAFNEFANVSERTAMIEEFFGPCYQLYKTPELTTLKEIIANNADKQEVILRNMKETLSVLVDKNVLQHSIVHYVFMEYFTHATPEARSEMIEILRESAIHMLHTREGARVAMLCLWHGSAKDRKVMVRSFKTFVKRICLEEYGHMVLLAAFDSIDDTKVMQKVILDEIVKDLPDIITDQFGRKVVLYLLCPRNPLHFHPDVMKVINQGDENTQSKKDVAIRRRELLDAVSKPLVQYVAEHCREIVTDNASLLTLLAIITHTKADPTTAMQAISKIASEPFTAGSLENMHIVEHTAGHLTLKKLILNDAERMKAGEKVIFSCILLDILPEGALKSWAACNRGCFILIHLIELNHPDVSPRVKEELKPVKASLKKMKLKGAQILLKKLS